MPISAPQILILRCHIHIAALYNGARVLTQTVINFLVVFGHSEAVKRARLPAAEPRICFVADAPIARYDHIFRLVFLWGFADFCIVLVCAA